MGRTLGLVAAIVAVGVFACGASAEFYAEQYEMNYMPTDAAGALNGNVMTPADGSGTYGPSGCVVSGGLLEFLDDSNSSGNQGIRLNNAGALLQHAGYTADLRVKVIAGCEGNGGQKSMGFAGEPANGRGLRLDTGAVHYVSSGSITNAPIDLATGFVTLRILVQTNGSQTTYYWTGSGWSPLITVTNPGGTGVNVAISNGPGYFIGSWGGSSTTLSHYYVDYLRIGLGASDVNKEFERGDITGCGSALTPTGITNVTGLVNGGAMAFASADLGEDNWSNLSHGSGGDGVTTTWTKGGRLCRRSAGDGYMYFNLADALGNLSGADTTVTIAFDYFSEGDGQLGLNYDSTDLTPGDPPPGAFKDPGTSVDVGHSGVWQQASFTITDAGFTNRTNGNDFRLWRFAGNPWYIDKVVIKRTPGPRFNYFLTNSGGTDLTGWSASEVTAAGVANDYGWLSLTTEPTSGAIAQGASLKIKAQVDTSSFTTAATDKAYVKVDDGCVTAPLTADEVLFGPANFGVDYAAGALAGQKGWIGTAGAEIGVLASGDVSLRVQAHQAAPDTSASKTVACESSLIDVSMRVAKGDGTNTLAQYQILDGGDSGRVLSKIYLTGSNMRIHDLSSPGGATYTGVPWPTTGDPPVPDAKGLRVRIDTAARTTQVYLGEVAQLTTPYVIPIDCVMTSGQLTVKLISYHYVDGGTVLGEYVDLDDVEIKYPIGAQPYMIREVDLNVIGCQGQIQPRSVALTLTPGVNETSTRYMTFTNTGGTTISDLAIDTIAPGSPWGHVDVPWLTTEIIPSSDIAPGAFATVKLVATLGSPPLAVGAYDASLKFIYCGGEDKLVTSTPEGVFLTVTPAAVRYDYEMDEDLVNNPQATGAPGMIAGGDTPTPYGAEGGGGGYGLTDPLEDCLVYSRFVDTGADGVYGYYLLGLGLGTGATGYTMDMRIWGEEMTVPGTDARRSISIANDQDQGRRVRIEPYPDNASTTNALRITFVGAGVINPPGEIIVPATSTTSRFHMIRFVVYNNPGGADAGKKIEVYDLENDEDPTPEGVSWKLLGTCTNLGGTHDVPPGIGSWVPADAGGIVLNSMSGSTECLGSRWSADWVRIVQNIALDPAADVIGGAEAQCWLFADPDLDGDVDQDDFATFQVCYTGPSGSGLSNTCKRFDHGDDNNDGQPEADGNIDSFDFTAFENCATGPDIPWTQEATPNCKP